MAGNQFHNRSAKRRRVILKLREKKMFDNNFLMGETEEIRKFNKEFQKYIYHNSPQEYYDLFRLFLKETEDIRLELTEKHYDFCEFPKVLKLKNLRIPTGPLCNIESIIRCCWGITYHKLGYTTYHMESDKPYLEYILDNPIINTVGRFYLMALAEKGYIENLKCFSSESVNNILKCIGLEIEV